MSTTAQLHTRTNRLANETSPYLLQHAHNPVDWYPWGEEALEKARAPQAYLRMLWSVDFLAHPPKEIALVGRPGAEDTKALVRAIYRDYVPNKVVAFLDPERNSESAAKAVPLLARKTPIDGAATAYVCRDFVCGRPAASAEELARQLAGPPAETARAAP